jgi:hypothetical protein
MASPVWDAAGAETLSVERLGWKPAPDYLVIRRLALRATQYTRGPALDLGAQLAIALSNEGTALGLRMVSPGSGGFTVGGAIEDLWLETRPIMFGPIMFYAYMDLALEVRRGDGAPLPIRYRFHNMYARANGGFGMQDEAAEALAQFLVDSAQELAARLNRDFVHAPAHPGVRLEAQTLAAGSLDDREAQVRRLGLSGAGDIVPLLLARLAAESDEGNRVYLLDALANLASPEIVAPLAQRYPGEDEDCRFFILKAWDYEGGEEARDLIAQHGPRDPDPACRALAGRVAE